MADKDADEQKSESSASEEILRVARERFDIAVEAETANRIEAIDDLKFLAGEQWDPKIRQQREADNRPCITINRLPQHSRQVTNEQRQNRPSIRISPVDDQSDPETAKIIQGHIRHIERSSGADAAYDTAFEAAVHKGVGYFRIITDYVDPLSFDQEILIRLVRNSFTVYLDPNYQERDGSDANWGFVFEDLSFEDFEAKWPNAVKPTDADAWSSIGDQAENWVTTNTIRVAEYFYKTFKETTIYLLDNGQVIEKPVSGKKLPDGLNILKERRTVLPAIKWCKMTGCDVLEQTDWPGRWIPIIPVLGDEVDVNGKRILSGIIRHAKDPQRMHNYWNSSATETIALAPRAPYIGYEGQFEGHEQEWADANRKNFAYLEVKPVTLDGKPAPLPQRNAYEPPIQAMSSMMLHSSDDIKATTGIYDASLGNRSNEQSGIAIQRRNIQAQTSNFHFIDNMSRSIRHAGRIIIDLMPHIYDTPRTIRIIGPDDEEEIVRINEMFGEGDNQKAYMMNVGKYDVAIDSGPSFATRRQEAVQSMLDFLKAFPQAAPYIADLLAKHMDWPGAKDLSERLKKMAPPGVIDDKDAKKPLPPEVAAQLQQMSQMIEQLTAHLNEANDTIKTKKMELESRERIEFAKLELEANKVLATLESQEASLAFKHELEMVKSRLDMLQIDSPIGFEPGAGPEGAVMPPENPQPTGGNPPGTPME